MFLLPMLPIIRAPTVDKTLYGHRFCVFLNCYSSITVLHELTKDSEVQEIWFSAVLQLNATLIIPLETLRRQIRSHFGSMVEIRYPDLVNNGMYY